MQHASDEGGVAYETAPGLLIKHWHEGTGVVFDPGRARTHLVSAEALALLSGTLAAGQTAGPELLHALAAAGLLRRRP